MDTLHWLRPVWLWALLPLILLFLLYWFRLRQSDSAWEKIVDPQLQPFVIEGSQSKQSYGPVALFLAWMLIILMMAGPVWQQQEVPVFQAMQAEVILFDLSGSMLSDDIAPDRLTRARFKLSDLLKQSQGRQTALIAFTERPYIISPLTEDAETINAFLPSLHPEIMPVLGSRLDLAMERAVNLLEQSNVTNGHVIYIGDAEVTDKDLQAADTLRNSGHRLSVIGVGTAAGTPLRDSDGRFMRHADGRIVVPQLDNKALQSMADAGGGTFVELTTDATDLASLDATRKAITVENDNPENSTRDIYWVEFSPWLLWPLLLSALFLFRKGVLI